MKKEQNKIEFISASAGTGKTHTLMSDLFDVLSSNEVRPTGVMAVTFTEKAAAELGQRVRQRLLEGGRADLAQMIETARIGTVHGVCTRLLTEFAYEAGLSPSQRVLGEDEGPALFRQTLTELLTPERLAILGPLASRMSLDSNTIIALASDMAKSARGNDISSEQVRVAASDSRALIARAFPSKGSANLTQEMKTAISEFFRLWPEPAQTTKKAIDAYNKLINFKNDLANKADAWKDWISMAKTDFGAKANDSATVIKEIAARVCAHPNLHSDLATFLEQVHELAALTMNKFAEKKRKLGLIDYQDMEQQTLHLLDCAEVQESLRTKIDLLMVDEFQDTNPVQLAIFLKLSAYCPRTIFVGDLKQSIFRFRGADITLIQAILKDIETKSSKILKDNYRSRPELVEFTSTIFEAAFLRDGIAPETVRVEARKNYKTKLPPLSVWWHPKKKDDSATAIAREIRRLLDSHVKVTDRLTGELREILPCDIGILVRTNPNIAMMSAALREVGIETSDLGGTLSEFPETALLCALVAYALDSRDTLAAAEVATLLGHQSGDKPWYELAAQEAPTENWHPVLQKLAGLQEMAKEATPSEFIDTVITLSGLENFLESQGHPGFRLAIINSIRAFARRYENTCQQMMIACSIRGLLKQIESDESDAPSRSSSANTMDVLTYHRAKGLEWPIVVLFDLNSDHHDGDLFGLRVVGPEGKDFNVKTPLRDRKVVYLPYPFGGFGKPEIIKNNLDQDKEVQRLDAASEAEDRRLLYVGMTRAREALIMAFPEEASVELRTFIGSAISETSTPLVELPGPKNDKIKIGKTNFDCTSCILTIDEVTAATTSFAENVFPPTPSNPIKNFPLSSVAPSQLVMPINDGKLAALGEVIHLGEPIKLKSKVEPETLGNALHTFFAADNPASPLSSRKDLAKEILLTWKVDNALDVDDVITFTDRLEKVTTTRWPGANTFREYPMLLTLNGTRMTGSIDRLQWTKNEIAIIDHKSVVADAGNLTWLLEKYAAQLAAYSFSAEHATDVKNVTCWLHLPLSGLLVQVKLSSPRQMLVSAAGQLTC